MSGTLSHTPSQIIRQLIIDLGLGSDGGASWPVYAVQMPNTPDNCVGVIDRAGVGRGRFQVGGEVQEVYGVQIIVRAGDGQTAHVKADAIKSGLTQDVHLDGVTVTDEEGYGTATQGYIVYNVSHRSGPFVIPESDTDRKIASLNMLASIQEN